MQGWLAAQVQDLLALPETEKLTHIRKKEKWNLFIAGRYKGGVRREKSGWLARPLRKNIMAGIRKIQCLLWKWCEDNSIGECNAEKSTKHLMGHMSQDGQDRSSTSGQDEKQRLRQSLIYSGGQYTDNTPMISNIGGSERQQQQDWTELDSTDSLCHCLC